MRPFHQVYGVLSVRTSLQAYCISDSELHLSCRWSWPQQSDNHDQCQSIWCSRVPDWSRSWDLNRQFSFRRCNRLHWLDETRIHSRDMISEQRRHFPGQVFVLWEQHDKENMYEPFCCHFSELIWLKFHWGWSFPHSWHYYWHFYWYFYLQFYRLALPPIPCKRLMGPWYVHHLQGY